ncbi:hypothetical protein [Actinomyces culturomici]|uniref:hypothetical protein n=1 Tax=Actinomyces culturomici TaxID=1926276 RepID=UPI00135AC4EC|nr:hypothetical protein [Actinomyces culturomici]
MNPRSRTLSLSSLLLVGALALAGCAGSASSSGTDAAASGGASATNERVVFEFASTPDSAPGGEVTVQFPDGLTEALEIDNVTVPVKSVTLRSQEVTSTSLCAVEGHVEFNEGGEAVVTKPVPPKTNINEKTGEAMPEEGDRSSMGPAHWAARYYGVAMDAPYGSEILPMSQFDANKPEEGVYMDSPDSFVEVLPCATSVDDNGSGVKESFGFQRVDSESESGSSDFAFVTFSVMRDGTILIPSAKVNGYTRDGSGSWVQKHK